MKVSEFVSKLESEGILQMREAHRDQVAQVLLENHYGNNGLEEVELSHASTDFIVSEDRKPHKKLMKLEHSGNRCRRRRERQIRSKPKENLQFIEISLLYSLNNQIFNFALYLFHPRYFSRVRTSKAQW